MKKGKKILVAVLAVVVVAAIVVCGLVLGGVINFGEDRTAKAGELVEDDFLSTTYRSQQAVYSFTLKSIYGITDAEVNDFFADQSNAWKTYTQQVRIENKGDTTLVVLGSAVENNGIGNVWVRILPDSAELNIAPGGAGEFHIEILAKGYSDIDSLADALKQLAPTLVCVDNPNANPNEDFDSSTAEKFNLEIKF
ncbi:MAG: hypothetical protein ACI4JR_06785 [Acutalibacteraceae bacterium]